VAQGQKVVAPVRSLYAQRHLANSARLFRREIIERAIALALHKNGHGASVQTNHESTKRRKHEKKALSFGFLSCFRSFVLS
jgi:hypothetical protein